MKNESAGASRSARWVALAAAVWVAVACSPDVALPSGTAASPCEDGATRACGDELAAHEDVLTCFQGTQRCVEGSWTSCGNGHVLSLRRGVVTERLRTLAVTSAACANRPCDPTCQIFEDQPDAGWFEAGTPGEGGVEGGASSLYDWPGGSLLDYPQGLVKKGLKEPCKTGSDCQFNQQCSDVATGATCAHTKCATGAALAFTCDSCVALICAEDVSCCGGSLCDHDVCVAGAKLDSACSPCATTICAAHPECCTTGWSAACVAWAASLCGACTCPTGQTAYGGQCYKLTSSTKNWSKARSDCTGIGTGWDLVEITDSGENDFVKGQIGGAGDVWTGITDQSDEGMWLWPSGASASYSKWGGDPDDGGGTGQDFAQIHGSDGLWTDESFTATERSVCEGPAAPGCASGQTHSGTRCYELLGAATYASSRTACQALGTGWDLTEIGDATENSTIAGITVSSSNYWVGLTDAAAEGTWLWNSSGAPSYTSWAGQPDGGASENCSLVESTDGFWSDESCSDSMGSVCEGPKLSSCPSGWTTAGSRCLQAFTSTKTRAAAETACVALGGHLASIESASENATVLGLTSGSDLFWLGYTDATTEGTWAWEGGSTATYTNWPNEPNGSTAQNCARLDDATGSWTDEDCTASGDSVCEGPKVAGCPSGWTTVGSRCVKAYTSTDTWANAEAFCVAQGGHLASIESAAENVTMLGLSLAGKIYWVGYNDQTTEGTFAWKGGSTATYTNWVAGSPDGGVPQDCVGLDDTGGKWGDYACTDSKRYFCELTPPTCASGTTEHSGTCYTFETTNRTWAAARTACQAYGAGYDLSIVDDAAESTWIQGNLASPSWLGLTDSVTEGSWLTISGGAASYLEWYAPYPDGGASANCAAIDDATGSWNDYPCTESKRYVCEVTPPLCATGTTEQSGSCYEFQTSNKTWSAAETACQALGTGYHLASVDDATEQTWIQGQLTEDSWVGLSDAVTESTWVWADGASSTYRNFRTEPDGGTADNCAYFDDADSLWRDSACTSSLRAVCEGPESAVTCPAGETASGGSCYYNETGSKTWAAAETACQARGASYHLATVSGQTENDALVSIIGSTRNAWIGFSDQTTEGTFAWPGSEASTFTAWRADPNDNASDDCGRITGAAGIWTSESCSGARKALCEGPAEAPAASGTWDQDCVDAVGTVCDAACGSTGAGACSPWLPTQTESWCPTLPDLALGPACEGEQVPVCNQGQVAAPAGVTLAWFPANSTQYPKCSPDLAKRKDTPGDCVVNEPIPPGECVTITCPGMTNNAEILVNPPGTGHVEECSCQDNWSLYDQFATCGPPECSAGVSQSTLRKVNLYFIVDRSDSMSSDGKWDGTRAALRAFFESQTAAGIGVALEFFPVDAGLSGDASGDGCGSDAPTCSPDRCGNPYVSLGTLTTDAAPTDAQEAALVAPLQAGWLQGGTPTWPALVGALDWASARQATYPNESHIVVFATDGQPSGDCLNGSAVNTNTQLAVQAGAAYDSSSVRTYTIGLLGANNAALDAIASAGGTDQAFVIDGADPTEVSTQLEAAFASIVGQNVSCDFDLPDQGLFDPASSTLTSTTGAGVTTALAQVTGPSACGTGWYYDDPTSPTKVTLCQNSCDAVRSDTNARIEVHLGCPAGSGGTAGTGGTGTLRRQYQATCGRGQSPQWGFLTWQTTVPAGATLALSFRVALAAADLATATFVDAGAIPTDPELCALSGPAPCPKDVWALLGGGPETHFPFLELEIQATSSTTAPSVDQIEITYSCVDSR